MRERYVDRISTRDELRGGKILMNGRRPSTLRTEISIIDYDGKEVVGMHKGLHNMTILGGRLDILEKTFGINPNPNQRLLLNNMIPVPKMASDVGATTYTDVPHPVNVMDGPTNPNKFNRFCKYFCIGSGGESATQQYVAYQVNDWETRLYDMVPFRMVPVTAPLTPAEAANYRLKKQVSVGGTEYFAYYAKKFDVGVLHSVKNELEYVTPDLSIDDSDPMEGDGAGHSMHGYTVQTYIEFTLEVNEIEFKEFYRATHNNTLALARLSELGLITGFDCPVDGIGGSNYLELANAELFAKLTHEPVFLSTTGSRRTVNYRIYS